MTANSTTSDEMKSTSKAKSYYVQHYNLKELVETFSELLSISPIELLFDIHENGRKISYVIEKSIRKAILTKEILHSLEPTLELIRDGIDSQYDLHKIAFVIREIEAVKKRTEKAITDFAESLELLPELLLLDIEYGTPLENVVVNAINEAGISFETRQNIEPILIKANESGLLFDSDIKAITKIINKAKGSTLDVIARLAIALKTSPNTLLLEIKDGFTISQAITRSVQNSNISPDILSMVNNDLIRIQQQQKVSIKEIQALANKINIEFISRSESIVRLSMAFNIDPLSALIAFNENNRFEQIIMTMVESSQLSNELTSLFESAIYKIAANELINSAEISHLVRLISKTHSYTFDAIFKLAETLNGSKNLVIQGITKNTAIDVIVAKIIKRSDITDDKMDILNPMISRLSNRNIKYCHEIEGITNSIISFGHNEKDNRLPEIVPICFV